MGQGSANLTPFARRLADSNEVMEGHDFSETLNSIMTGLVTGMPHMHGFKVRQIGPGPTRHLGSTFSAEESAKFIQFTQSNSFTVNQVVHAALMMVCAFDNPPSPDTPSDAPFVGYGLVNCRHRLQPEYSGRDGYPGYCLGASPIVVPLSILTAASDVGEKAQLIQMATAVKAEYLRQKAYPSLLAVIGQEVDLILSDFRKTKTCVRLVFLLLLETP
ncbi:hypothetical protein B0H10DRAFT_1076725 [Mycena sp. CBHHK59/15]|nr:hypothetical protein B0H10DRAFT_1076725 [Mycena sp. CBHHK59/15]